MIILSAAPSQTLAGTSEVENLQKALKSLAQVTGNPTYDPGTVDGTVGDKTVNAVASALPELSSHLPSSAGQLLNAALIVGIAWDPEKAREQVRKNAAALTAATFAVIAAKAISSGATTPNASIVKANAFNNMQTRLASLLNPGGAPNQGAITSNTIWAFDPKKGFRIAQPVGLHGAFGAPPTYVEVAISPTQPTTGTQVSIEQYLGLIGQTPWYKTWWGMTGIGLSAVGLTFLVIRIAK